MNVVQISKQDQEQTFEMLSAVLWLGNISFGVVEHDNHAVVDENEGNSFLLDLNFLLGSFMLVINVCLLLQSSLNKRLCHST
jgi:hypothetical protein